MIESRTMCLRLIGQSKRLLSTGLSSNQATITKQFPLLEPLQVHRLRNDSLPTHGEASQKDLLSYLEQMTRIRKMEQAADALYKARMIRGFCHLSVGQEGIPVAMEASLSDKDAIITAYRYNSFV
jgi:hypothetical protein